MARGFQFSARVGDGLAAQTVGYSAKQRGDYLAVTFVMPDGTRQEKMTRCQMRGKNPEPEYHTEAARIIARAYAPTYPQFEKKKWAEALEEAVTTCQARPETIRAFRTAVAAVQKFLPEVESPHDVTPELAQRFGRLFLHTPYTRGGSLVQRKRTPVTLSYYTRSLSALWRHFKVLGFVKINPWGEVDIPPGDTKKKYVPTREDIGQFFGYITTRYPEWHRLHALLTVKLLSACRTADVCQLRTEQIQNNVLVFLASQTKTKADRSVPLPADLAATLTRLGGKVHLWQDWCDDVRRFRPGRNKIPETFQASTVKVVLNNIFREYSDSHPDRPRMSPHDFRRFAITTMVRVVGSVDLAATTLGITSQCAAKHYLDAQQAFDALAAYGAATPELLPPQSPTIPPLKPHNEAPPDTTKHI